MSIGGSDSNEGTVFSKVDATDYAATKKGTARCNVHIWRKKSHYIYTKRSEIIVITVIKIHGLFVLQSEEIRVPRSRWRFVTIYLSAS